MDGFIPGMLICLLPLLPFCVHLSLTYPVARFPIEFTCCSKTLSLPRSSTCIWVWMKTRQIGWFNMVQWFKMVESSESKRMVKIWKSQKVFFDQLPFVLVRLLRPSPYAKNVRVRQREGQGRCFQEGQTGVLALRRRYATI